MDCNRRLRPLGHLTDNRKNKEAFVQRDSPEVFDQHQVDDRGIRSRIKDRTTIRRDGETRPNIAQTTSDCNGLALGKVEEIEARFARRPVDIVNPLFHHRECPRNDSVQQPDGLATGSRDPPQGARVSAQGVGVVNVGGIGGLERYLAAGAGDLDGISAGRRNLPDLVVAGSFEVK